MTPIVPSLLTCTWDVNAGASPRLSIRISVLQCMPLSEAIVTLAMRIPKGGHGGGL